MAEVKSAQITISEHWADHVHHKTVGKAPRWSPEQGVICACGEVLGWPDPENKETLSQYTKRVASEQVDTASAPGRTKGAFGSYGQAHRPEPHVPEPDEITGDEPVAPYPGSADNAPEPGDYPESEVQEPPVDWGNPDPEPDEGEAAVWDATAEPPEDEPEPEVLAIEDGDGEDVGTAPFPADAVPDERGFMISGGKSYGKPTEPADEAQAGPPYAVGDKVTVGGIEFTKHSESPFPEHNADAPPWDAYGDYGGGPKPPAWEGVDDHPGPGWADGERSEAAEIANGSQAEYSGGEVEKPSNEGVGQALVPYRGVPIMPGEGQELDPLSGRLAPLDPTLPYTPQDVELKIVEILRQLENSELFLRQQLARLHQATHNHDFRYNLALAQSDQRAADQRKAEAWLATEKERHEMTEAEMLVRALRDSQHNLRAQLSGFQSVARSLAVSMVNSLDGRDKPPTRALADRIPPDDPRPWDR